LQPDFVLKIQRKTEDLTQNSASVMCARLSLGARLARDQVEVVVSPHHHK
jgi:hypothetical protein